MKFLANPFLNHPLNILCREDFLNPFKEFIYFMNGIAFASNGYILVGISLSDINTPEELIKCVDHFKIHYTEFQVLNTRERLFLTNDGEIVIDNGITQSIPLLPLEYRDPEHKYLLITDYLQKAIAEQSSHSTNISEINISLSSLHKVQMVMNLSSPAKFVFLRDPNRVLLKFEDKSNTFAIVMPSL